MPEMPACRTGLEEAASVSEMIGRPRYLSFFSLTSFLTLAR
jgi:hypothetical protein